MIGLLAKFDNQPHSIVVPPQNFKEFAPVQSDIPLGTCILCVFELSKLCISDLNMM